MKGEKIFADVKERRSAFYMKLNDEPFYKIKNGEKTVEIRLYDEKRQSVAVGDIIQFIRRGAKNDVITTEVLALHRFNTFKELLSSEIFSKCGFNGKSVTQATENMYWYYTKEREEKYGVLGIEFVVKNKIFGG